MKKYLVFLALLMCGCPPPAAQIKSHETIVWERIGGSYLTQRTRTPHGWLVIVEGGRCVYVPDEGAAWLSSGVEAR
jgi:hypothetical protein